MVDFWAQNGQFLAFLACLGLYSKNYLQHQINFWYTDICRNYPKVLFLDKKNSKWPIGSHLEFEGLTDHIMFLPIFDVFQVILNLGFNIPSNVVVFQDNIFGP